MENWLWEAAAGVGRFLLHPVLYIFIIANLLAGRLRVSRERHDFHSKVYPSGRELQSSLLPGIGLGLFLSAVMVVAGIVLSTASLLLIALWTAVFALLLQFRFASPAYSLGFTTLLFLFLPSIKTNTALDTWLQDRGETSLTALAVLMGLLLLAEGLLIAGKAADETTPRLWKGKRGLPIGVHVIQKFWFVPVFVPVPGEALTRLFDWWPVIHTGAETFSLFLVPFGIGFARSVRGMLPHAAIAYTGRRVAGLGLLVLLLGAASYWLPGVAVAAAGIAMLGRFTIMVRERLEDDKLPAYFKARNGGLTILDTIPGSPARELGLKAGEIITRVNGTVPASPREFYEALQLNTSGAFCSIDVLDTDGELRNVRRGLFAGEHHELGIIFVEREHKLDTEAI
ncbi:PDZ domain-containing protein [Ectobacillus ponti]|uniref:PDZ domain-containing protein n=1 Tax=Ectobacillus ponti TaxID=2961894 RepID=A0AA41X7B3_9BACI|nr:PDZ domain-containing protein [Ectobacillus ponti]MCP8967613.1 PDZ domain-containing protein [Ectobacillus ponti]